MFKAKRILIVVAHPDDEVLGCGGTVSRLTELGIDVHACVMSGGVAARTLRPRDEELRSDMNKAKELLGIASIATGDFDNIKFNVVPHLLLVQFIEKSIRQLEPDIVLTHHPSDLNNDHVQTSIACQAAIRLPQRDPTVKAINGLYYMEVLSATDWSLPGTGAPFVATTFVNIESTIAKKVRALSAYRGVVRAKPHPRSPEVIEALATYRGGQAGFHRAEAFQLAFEKL